MHLHQLSHGTWTNPGVSNFALFDICKALACNWIKLLKIVFKQHLELSQYLCYFSIHYKKIRFVKLFEKLFIICAKFLINFLVQLSRPSMRVIWNWSSLDTLNCSITLTKFCLLFYIIIICWKFSKLKNQLSKLRFKFK
jgi:hypothetical protein